MDVLDVFILFEETRDSLSIKLWLWENRLNIKQIKFWNKHMVTNSCISSAAASWEVQFNPYQHWISVIQSY